MLSHAIILSVKISKKGDIVMKKKIDSALFSSILYIVAGILLAVMPGDFMKWALLAIGIFFIVSGILEMVKKNWVGGVVSIAIGVAIIILEWFILKWIFVVLGVLIALKGVVALINAIKYNTTVLGLLFPILTIIAGVGIAFGGLAGVMLIIAGIFLAVNGVIGLIGALKK